MKTLLLSLVFSVISIGITFAQFNQDTAIIVNGSVPNAAYSIPKVVAVDSGYFVTYYDEADGYKMYIQFIDPKGFTAWPDPVVVTDYEQDSWVSDYSLISDGHYAYVVFSDARNGTTDKDIFGYKFDQNGHFLWDSAGIELVVAPSAYDAELDPKATTLPNGDMVSAWNKMDAAGYTIDMQWLTAEGERVWPNGNLIFEDGLRYYEPNVLPATDSTIFLVYIYQDGQYGDRQIHAQHIDTTGQNIWDSAIVVTDNSGIGMGRTFNLQPATDGGIYVTWYGDPDSNSANDVFSQKINIDGSVSFQTNGLNLSPNDMMNQTMPYCVGENSEGNAVYMWQEVNGSNTGDLIKTQVVSSSGELLLGESALTVTDQHNMFGSGDFRYGNLYCPVKVPGESNLQMLIYNYQTADTLTSNMGMHFEEMSNFGNGQYTIVATEGGSQVVLQNYTYTGESGIEAVTSESHLSAFAGLKEFHPDTLFYYLPTSSIHTWDNFASNMNIYQHIDLLDTVNLEAGNYRVNVYADDSTYTTYQFSFVNEPGTEVESTYSYSLWTHIDLENNYVFAEMQIVKERENYIDLELSPGARLKVGEVMDVDYSMMNDTIHDFLVVKMDADSAFMDFKVVDYNGNEENWILIMTIGGGGIQGSSFNGKVYPIPAKDQLFVESMNRIHEISIIDLQGRKQLSQKVNGRNILLSVSDINSGIYVLQVIDDNGISFKRIVIE